jgi:carboxymethylenebutenolidase
LRTLTSADGTRFAAFEARPAEPSGVGVVVLPDNRGLRGFYQQLAVRLAEHGHRAVAIDYFGRSDGVNRDRPDDFPVMEHLMRLTPAGVYGDIATAAEELRAGPDACPAVVALGFCLGGRFAFLTAEPRFGFAGVIGFYGAPGPLQGTPGPIQRAAELTAPILGLFGGADPGFLSDRVARPEQPAI